MFVRPEVKERNTTSSDSDWQQSGEGTSLPESFGFTQPTPVKQTSPFDFYWHRDQEGGEGAGNDDLTRKPQDLA